MSTTGAHVVENPFFVLGVGPEAPRAVVEREGQKLLAMLEVGLTKAKTYETPLGPRARTPELVRWALAELRQPERRLVHELWAAAPVAPVAAGALENPLDEKDSAAPGWPEARVAYGWEPR
jgi:hypothetical protein